MGLEADNTVRGFEVLELNLPIRQVIERLRSNGPVDTERISGEIAASPEFVSSAARTRNGKAAASAAPAALCNSRRRVELNCGLRIGNLLIIL